MVYGLNPGKDRGRDRSRDRDSQNACSAEKKPTIKRLPDILTYYTNKITNKITNFLRMPFDNPPAYQPAMVPIKDAHMKKRSSRLVALVAAGMMALSPGYATAGDTGNKGARGRKVIEPVMLGMQPAHAEAHISSPNDPETQPAEQPPAPVKAEHDPDLIYGPSLMLASKLSPDHVMFEDDRVYGTSMGGVKGNYSIRLTEIKPLTEAANLGLKGRRVLTSSDKDLESFFTIDEDGEITQLRSFSEAPAQEADNFTHIYDLEVTVHNGNKYDAHHLLFAIMDRENPLLGVVHDHDYGWWDPGRLVQDENSPTYISANHNDLLTFTGNKDKIDEFRLFRVDIQPDSLLERIALEEVPCIVAGSHCTVDIRGDTEDTKGIAIKAPNLLGQKIKFPMDKSGKTSNIYDMVAFRKDSEGYTIDAKHNFIMVGKDREKAFYIGLATGGVLGGLTGYVLGHNAADNGGIFGNGNPPGRGGGPGDPGR